MKTYLTILKIVLYGRSAGKILLATIFSFTFSIAVILSTFGLMDGFDYLLKSGLRHSSGDILITNRKGFFELNPDIREKIGSVNPISITPIVQTEAFAMYGEMSKGVLVRGIENNTFSKTSGLEVFVPNGGIVVGEELAEQFKLRPGDVIALTFGRGNETASSLPMIRIFNLTGVVKHGIYQKDLRFVYLNIDDINSILELQKKVNLVVISTQKVNSPLKSLDPIVRDQKQLKRALEPEFIIRPFWNEYEFLIEAVKVEKFSISLILQLIVVVAVFNIIAFVIYIMEKKAQDFFFLRAVGLALRDVTRFWFISVIFIWAFSCIGAYFLTEFFDWSLKHLSLFKIPGDIYVLSGLNLRLNLKSYITVYGISLLWILIATMVGYLRLKRKTIIQGLRQEFSS